MSNRLVDEPREPANVAPTAVFRKSCLIKEPTDAQGRSFSKVRETDARTALKRGLANYIESLPPFTHPTHGRRVDLIKVYDVWPDQEEKRVFPSATVYSTLPHQYDASSFTPVIDPACALDTNTYLVKFAEIALELTLDVVTTDPEERIAVMMQLEDALNPVDWMYGFQLELPHYHNLIGVYELQDANFPDDEPSVFSRNRFIRFTVTGQVAVVRLKKIAPLNEVRTTVTVVDGNDPC